ncbi:mitochondrial intermediate peptidase [Rhypophila decipiens]|uniref:Mitochondrial intermediate peptidase n=1 Tax=Rhypophila decipiens TaxID=261697 RepID=A0AAN7BAE6_9PEZI|nr:mitochondrial intermediate peptidase [Rhypophila decipiens]
MLRSAVRPQGWSWSRCLLRKAAPIRQTRDLSLWSRSASAVSADPAPGLPVSHAPGGTQHNDELLRKIFDNTEVWSQFAARDGRRQSVGLFRNPYLSRPDGFLTYAKISLRRAKAIVDRVLTASTVDEYRRVVRQLDRLSDILCRVLDMSDFVRVTHPDHTTRIRADEAWEMVYRYMNELNTMTGLNDQLGKAMDNPDVTRTWTEEEKTVAEVLKLDFTKSAVNLPKQNRDQFVEISSEISQVGNMFMQTIGAERNTVKLPKLGQRVPIGGSQASLILRSSRDEEIRKIVYTAARTANKTSVGHLNRLMRLRSELALLSGFESYGHLALRDRMMAKDPESVKEFLQALTASNQPAVQQEVAALLAEKAKVDPSATAIEPWDREFYSETVRHSLRSKRRYDDFMQSYFSLGTVIQGMSRLFTRLYGIRLEPREVLPGETWHPAIRRLDVISDVDGHVAVLYCDLFYHPDKQPNPAHFTLRCSREILEDELVEYGQMLETDEGKNLFTSREDAANDGMSFSTNEGAVKQLPTIVLTCDFPTNTRSSRGPALLSFPQVETLFHEMGHAIHSVLARTSLQNVAGTRCATDLAELPSTLMEYFAADPTVLAMFARHYETDKALDYNQVIDHLRQSRRFEALDTENQIILAMLDQVLHSKEASNPSLDSTAIFHNIQRQYGSLPPDPPGTRWQGFFGHLFGYGSTYYAYLFDRVLAQRVWNVVFNAGRDGAALDRKNGEHLKENLLKWGGSRDPWKCLASTLREDRLAEGGKEAMALVGSWGAGSHLEK